ncbi:RNI-like protein [Hypoxylon sp. FL1857]|nr:RNI-like protein [Hypoxylon sp. FL1857]
MRRNRVPHSPPSPYRALAHHPANGLPPDSVSLIRSFNSETNPTRPIRPSPLTASTIPDMPLDLLDRMRSFPLFMSAPEEFLVAIGKHLRPQVHSAHDHILTEGDEAKAMYWLVRGVVGVTSRDGEAVYAELKPGAFFGEIGVLMDMPRTATIVARTKCLLLVLKKEDLQRELPRFPDMEKAIREEAHERLTILNKKRQESGHSLKVAKGSLAAREAVPGEVSTGEVGVIKEGAVVNTKKRKSPSPGVLEDPTGSALGSGLVNVRQTLKELPLFSTLPPDILHFLGMSAQPKTFPPFTDIIRQGTVGNEIYFIVRGEVEVIYELPEGQRQKRITRSSLIRPRLRQGQYFGEVASLGLSHRRTATVRSITAVECLMISGEALDELWKRCPPDIRKQVEDTARTRIRPKDDDVEMTDAELSNSDVSSPSTPTRSTPQVTFTNPSKPASPVKDESDQMEPKDPDPYLSVDMENLRNRRRGSLAPPTPSTTEAPGAPITNGLRLRKLDTSIPLKYPTASISPDSEVPAKKAKILPTRSVPNQEPLLPDDILVLIFQFFDIAELLRLRQLSSHMRKLLATSPKLCTYVDLTPYNRYVTDEALINIIAPFVGPRPVSIDISNCFHITDEGFSTLWKVCGKNIKIWRMKSVWDVSANQILDMSENAKGLEEVDWSNCRKVGDNLLARVVGWVVPDHLPPNAKGVVISNSAAAARLRAQQQQQQHQQQHQQQQKPQAPTIVLPPPGTIIGCPKLKRLNLSYCKHITDRSMAHMAQHASNRLQSLSLTRCTSITDAGFQAWAPFRFTNLSHLCLADCTYLSDTAIVALVHAAKSLTHLDLSFCCALSDTATEVVALGLPQLRELKMAFCGSAVSDNSLACIALHLNDLERLSVRGCVRVTANGIESVLDGCGNLVWADVSQCRNLEAWIRGGGVARWGYDERAEDGIAVGESPGSMAEREVSSPVRSPRSSVRSRARPGVAFVVEKGAGGLR